MNNETELEGYRITVDTSGPTYDVYKVIDPDGFVKASWFEIKSWETG